MLLQVSRGAPQGRARGLRKRRLFANMRWDDTQPWTAGGQHCKNTAAKTFSLYPAEYDYFNQENNHPSLNKTESESVKLYFFFTSSFFSIEHLLKTFGSKS